MKNDYYIGAPAISIIFSFDRPTDFVWQDRRPVVRFSDLGYIRKTGDGGNYSNFYVENNKIIRDKNKNNKNNIPNYYNGIDAFNLLCDKIYSYRYHLRYSLHRYCISLYFSSIRNKNKGTNNNKKNCSCGRKDHYDQHRKIVRQIDLLLNPDTYNHFINIVHVVANLHLVANLAA